MGWRILKTDNSLGSNSGGTRVQFVGVGGNRFKR